MEFTTREILNWDNGHWETSLMRKDFAELIDAAKKIDPHCIVLKRAGGVELKINIKTDQ